MEKITKSDIFSCNLYFFVSKLPPYLGNGTLCSPFPGPVLGL